MAFAHARTDVARREELRLYADPREPALEKRLRSHASWRIAPFVHALVWMATIVLSTATVAFAGDVSDDDMRSLDERVQEIKSDVLEIAAELTQLEEKLLYPSNTQVAVFVSLIDGHVGDLDSVEVWIDGESVAHHVYSYKEMSALGKGGVQRLYTGNLSTGDHRLVVSVKGKRTDGSEIAEQQDFTISKEATPKLVGLRLAANAAGDLKVELGDG